MTIMCETYLYPKNVCQNAVNPTRSVDLKYHLPCTKLSGNFDKDEGSIV